MLKKLVEASNLDNLLELRNIRYGDIVFHTAYVAINVDRNKTDQLRKGNEVVISESCGTPSCPVKILRRYLSKISPYVLDSGRYILRPYGFDVKLAPLYVSSVNLMVFH